MARLRRRREASRQGTWRRALIFNGLLFLVALLGAHIITTAYARDGIAGSPDQQALVETRRAMDDAFQKVVPKSQDPRTFWARQISRELAARDFSAARGYLLAAPVMLDRDDARAIQAAADAEDASSGDQRLVNAALLFLPNATRAEYQRAIEPPQFNLGQRARPQESEPARAATPGTASSPESAETGTVPERTILPSPEILPTEGYDSTGRLSFSMTGDRTDLVRRAQRWINGDSIDSMQIRLSAISLLGQERPEETGPNQSRAISVLKAAARAGRLTESYRDYLTGRLDRAMPQEAALDAVREALRQVAPFAQLEEQVLTAFETTINPEGLAHLQRDFAGIDRIAQLTSPSGAVTLLESAQSPEDVRKLELLSEAGGDRAVALAKQAGPRVLAMAKIGVKWSPALAVKVLFLTAIGLVLGWIVLSAVSRARPAAYGSGT